MITMPGMEGDPEEVGAVRKILISPGYGAGWTSWHGGSKDERLFMLEYEPFICALESGDGIDEALQAKFLSDFRERFPGADEPYMGGAEGLSVNIVRGDVRVGEYDGYESFVERDSDDGWL